MGLALLKKEKKKKNTSTLKATRKKKKKAHEKRNNLCVAKVSKFISESTEMHSFESASSVKCLAAPRGTGCPQISG